MQPIFDVDFLKLIGAANMPVSLIIAASIFLSMLTSRYVPTFARLRSLTDEYRGEEKDSKRRDSLKHQIEFYNRRVVSAQVASQWLNMSVIFFLLTVMATAWSAILPKAPLPKLVGVGTMVAGIICVIVSIALSFYDIHLANKVLGTEMDEFKEMAR